MADPILDTNAQREHFSITYLKAIATSAGFSMDEPRVDADSIDANIRAKGRRRPQLDIQLKATSSPVIRPDGLHYQLSRKNYDDLRTPDRITPAILAVQELPCHETDWFTCNSLESVLRTKMWWMSLVGYPRIDTGTKTVILPNAQLLTPASLTDILKQISRGYRP